ncbi:MAG: poly-beta-1,6-N-acetyl-D-glucosamine N-deacetylase PgaB [Thiomargarita sp.]|nr:poly-beta-1,6-N-acetyl-D-glucosamine N-deacetylase PgaB [Thiomargarita sp.]
MLKLLKQLAIISLLFAISMPKSWAVPLAELQKYIKNESFQALCYHDVRDDVVGDLDPDTMSVSTLTLGKHFAWLKSKGYNPISVDDILATRDGIRLLPDKAVLITFDDGYNSFYHKIFPLLKLYNFPAVLAVVGSWMEKPLNESFQYGTKLKSRKHLVTWEQVREMQASGLVEIASHSYNLHRGITSNSQGNTQAAAVSRHYDAETGYETDADYKQRIYEDLKKSSEVIEKYTGIKPRVMVWPYGHFNGLSVDAAIAAGMPITMTLESGYAPVTPASELKWVRRFLISMNIKTSDLVWHFRFWTKIDPIRVIHVDLDYVYDPDPKQQEKNLGKLIQRIFQMDINTVYLQAFADPDGDGVADSLYFPNRHLPMRADLFGRAAWQLHSRAFVDVFAWMPVLSFKLPDNKKFKALQIQESHNGKIQLSRENYTRLSPFKPETRKIIGEIYQDLAKHSWFSGLLFHDDAYLTDFEDASPEALDFYAKNGLPTNIEVIRNNPELMARWTRLKTEFLVHFTEELAKKASFYRIPTKGIVRNMYAEAVLNPDSEEWFAQSMEVFLKHYDYVALMAMPYMENAENPQEWLKRLVSVVASYPQGLKKTVFELQSVDWRHNNRPIASETLVKQMRLLKLQHALSFGYYPDDFLNNHPNFDTIKTGISLSTYPYKKR